MHVPADCSKTSFKSEPLAHHFLVALHVTLKVGDVMYTKMKCYDLLSGFLCLKPDTVGGDQSLVVVFRSSYRRCRKRRARFFVTVNAIFSIIMNNGRVIRQQMLFLNLITILSRFIQVLWPHISVPPPPDIPFSPIPFFWILSATFSLFCLLSQ